jgi:hypothetical protein
MFAIDSLSRYRGPFAPSALPDFSARIGRSDFLMLAPRSLSLKLGTRLCLPSHRTRISMVTTCSLTSDSMRPLPRVDASRSPERVAHCCLRVRVNLRPRSTSFFFGVDAFTAIIHRYFTSSVFTAYASIVSLPPQLQGWIPGLWLAATRAFLRLNMRHCHAATPSSRVGESPRIRLKHG